MMIQTKQCSRCYFGAKCDCADSSYHAVVTPLLWSHPAPNAAAAAVLPMSYRRMVATAFGVRPADPPRPPYLPREGGQRPGAAMSFQWPWSKPAAPAPLPDAHGPLPAKRDDFDAAVAFALRPENDGQPYHVTPGDHGGATAWGIIGPTLQTYLGRSVTNDDIKALTPDAARAVYRKLFWQALRCDQLPRGLNMLVFDHACGNPTSAANILQRMAGVADDGVIGPVTVAAAAKLNKPVHLVGYTNARLAFYQKLTQYPKFGRGWDRRANQALVVAKALLG